ncbi:hypothetical protein CEUSTIGMA_g4532.t1 [Chlamydomonas eustigma]|uniref:Vacuolar protein sorting-associated protein 52 A n=1 Tax=Chlamydomonas eustigma TaxID=1157962 RepID=A0A250X209_9CHLO|nr:hypothetical protein CEUSTIGMA_g4532.t1 [Chlamydomonas eustigma]|eukprot:GAX77086.1 hypothetical protein CEUSTIGMA_g4532.t1 [Chlamydomonas eustigma]
MTATISDSSKYAESLRTNLIADLFDGEEVDFDEDKHQQGYNIDDIIGSTTELQDVEADLDAFAEHEFLRGILERGQVVKEYARDIDDKLRQAEMESIQEYISESDNMVALHDQIKNCDGILGSMEQLLGKFQSDLGRVSEEIRQLQVQAQTMGTKLKSRRGTERKMGAFVQNMTVSERMVTQILEAEVGDDYLEYLSELDKKLKFVNGDEVAKASQSRKDLEPALEKLRIKAVTKVRDFLLQKVYLLKRPKTNLQIIQQSSLLKYKYFIQFLRSHAPDLFIEIRNEYMAVMSRILSSHFRTYLSGLEKMQTAIALQCDVLGVSDQGASSGVSGVSVLTGLFHKSAVSRHTTEHVFELGDRVAILEGMEDKAAVIPHMAEAEGSKLTYEVIFRNVHKLLVDTANSEYLFCTDFFEDEGVFRELFTPIINVVESDLATALQDNWDMVSILLMIRINHAQRKLLGGRRVPCLDDYLDRVQLLLWPRFKVLFDQQLASVRSGTERTLFQDSSSVHFVTKRYAALASSLLLLMTEYDSEESGLFKAQTFYDMMDRLWAAIFDLLLRMSNLFRDKISGIIFLTVNYAHIVSTYKSADAGLLYGSKASSNAAAAAATAAASSGAPSGAAGTSDGSATAAGIGRTGAAAIKDCDDQLQTCTGLYVEDQLSRHFPILVDYVKKAEQQQKRLAIPEGQAVPNFAPAQASPILRDFAVRWKDAIEEMNREVAKHFANTPCGRDVLQASMTSLLKYYTRLLELLKRQGPDGQALVRDAINIPSIMYEIKRITKS